MKNFKGFSVRIDIPLHFLEINVYFIITKGSGALLYRYMYSEESCMRSFQFTGKAITVNAGIPPLKKRKNKQCKEKAETSIMIVFNLPGYFIKL